MSPERVRLSRTARVLVEEARQNGLDPDPFIEKAVEAANQARRRKVGPFGPCAGLFAEFRNRIGRAQRPSPFS